MGAMWMSGKVTDQVIELKKDITSMERSEDKGSTQKINNKRKDHKQPIYEEIEISDLGDESEFDSVLFKKCV